MSQDYDNQVKTPVRGIRVKAIYRVPIEMEDARTNPLITALPAPWDWSELQPAIFSKLSPYMPPDRKTLEKTPIMKRHFDLQDFKVKFFQIFDRHRKLEQNISYSIRFGYLARNPMEAHYRRSLHDRIEGYELGLPQVISTANLCFSLLGPPGMGKSLSVGRILQLLPQVIDHSPEFHNHTQLVWLFMNCPHDKSSKQLCKNFLKEVDEVMGTNFTLEYNRETADGLLAAMAKVAAQLSLGMLVIDEIQFLNRGKSGGDEALLNFIVELENRLGIPVALLGTHSASNLITANPHLARRGSGGGGCTWKRFEKDDPEWLLFVEKLWQYQFTLHYEELTDDMKEAFYTNSQGVLDYAIKLFYHMQNDAIINETERITVDGLISAAIEHMEFDRPFILALGSPERHLYHGALKDILPAEYEVPYVFFGDKLLLPPKSESDKVQQAPMSITTSAAGANACRIPNFQPPAGSSVRISSGHQKCQKAKVPTRLYSAGTIMAICIEAVSVDIGPYEALKSAGIIRPATQFLPTSEPDQTTATA